LAVNQTTGAIYVADYNNPYIVQVDPITGSQSLVSSGGLLTRPTGITVVQATVPEPTSIAFAAVALTTLIALRRRPTFERHAG
jgi:DNA-binding beta-propeller fold protein YncE